MQSSGYLISSTAEFSACMQHSKYDLHGRKPRLFVDSDRDTTAIIHNCDGVPRIDRHKDIVAISGQCFIHCVIYNLIYQMMQSPRRGTADIHTGSFSYCLQTFQYLDLVCTVFCAHRSPPVNFFVRPFLLLPETAGLFESYSLQNHPRPYT